ncbi:MAG: hypothetical protein WA317_17715, partial [Mycobacterium sp.]
MEVTGFHAGEQLGHADVVQLDAGHGYLFVLCGVRREVVKIAAATADIDVTESEGVKVDLVGAGESTP